MTKIIYRMMTPKSLLLAILAALSIVAIPWFYKILYPEKAIIIKMEEEEYKIMRDKYAAFKAKWMYPMGYYWKREKYIYGVSSKLPYENRETKFHFQSPKELAIHE